MKKSTLELGPTSVSSAGSKDVLRINRRLGVSKWNVYFYVGEVLRYGVVYELTQAPYLNSFGGGGVVRKANKYRGCHTRAGLCNRQLFFVGAGIF